MHNDILDKFSESPEKYFEDIVSFFSSQDIKEDGIFKMANILADSGERINDIEELNTADIPSTGGPSSLTTILCPLYLVHSGYTVIKLGIPGRPAGGIDVLSQIENYKIEYNISEMKNTLLSSKYIHFLTNDSFAPLDGQLYKYRKATGNINIPNLAIASLLSKKIAIGIKNLGLDVRVWKDGNFGASFNEARLFSHKFIEVAGMAGINAKCFLSDASQPFQPYIGRGESLIAIYEIFNNTVDSWLQYHNEFCRKISEYMEDVPCYEKVNNIKEAFAANLKHQGSSYDLFVNKVNQIIEEPHYNIYSPETGYCYYNLDYIRNHIVSEQNKLIDKHILFPDPCGYILLKRPGSYVNTGEIIASYRSKTPESLEQARNICFIKKQHLIEKTKSEVIK